MGNDILNEKMRSEWNHLYEVNAFASTTLNENNLDSENINLEQYWMTGKEHVDELLINVDLQGKNKKTMVEIGCGMGRMTHRFSELFKYVYAIDVSDKLVEKLKLYFGHKKNIKVSLGDGNNLNGINDNSVDFVFSWEVFQHILNEDIIFEYFRESSRVLKKGGIAFMHVSTKKPKVVKFNMMKIFGFWDFIKMTMNNSPIYRPFHWRINKMIKKIKKYFISIKTNKINKLEKEFQKIDSWKGCYVNSDNLMNLLSELNFKPIRIINIGTKYTYYIVKKSA